MATFINNLVKIRLRPGHKCKIEPCFGKLQGILTAYPLTGTGNDGPLTFAVRCFKMWILRQVVSTVAEAVYWSSDFVKADSVDNLL